MSAITLLDEAIAILDRILGPPTGKSVTPTAAAVPPVTAPAGKLICDQDTYDGKGVE